MEDIDIVTRNVSLNASDPRLLAPTIAAIPPPPSTELIKRHSRFNVPSKTVEPEKGEEDIPSCIEHWYLSHKPSFIVLKGTVNFANLNFSIAAVISSGCICKFNTYKYVYIASGRF